MPELPTPSNADSPKQKKRREQAIVVGTLVLVILTFYLVAHHGTNAPVTSDANGFTPNDAGGTGGGSDPNLPALIGGIPGQVHSLDEGELTALRNRDRAQNRRLRKLAEELARLRKREHRDEKRIHDMQRRHPHTHGHPKRPVHPIHVTHHAPRHPSLQHGPHRHHPPTHLRGA